MNFESFQNTQDAPKILQYPYSEVQEIVRYAHESVAQYILGQTIDILFKNGFKPSEIVDAFADQVGLKFENAKATMLIEQASSVLFEKQSSTEKVESEVTESHF